MRTEKEILLGKGCAPFPGAMIPIDHHSKNTDVRLAEAEAQLRMLRDENETLKLRQAMMREVAIDITRRNIELEALLNPKKP